MHIDAHLPQYIRNILHQINRSNKQAYVVGGAVRDMVRGVEPKDFDIVTDATPKEVKAIFMTSKVIDTGIEHGTITVMVDKKSVEITTMRKDVATDGRRAVVEFTSSMEEDSLRRDFTMNALYMDQQYKLYDFHGGLEDIENKKIRFVGEPASRIEEDQLRRLRLFRFVATTGFDVDDASLLATVEASPFRMTAVSGERIFAELMKMVNGEFRNEAFRLLSKSKILRSAVGEMKENIFIPDEMSKYDFQKEAIICSIFKKPSEALMKMKAPSSFTKFATVFEDETLWKVEKISDEFWMAKILYLMRDKQHMFHNMILARSLLTSEPHMSSLIMSTILESKDWKPRNMPVSARDCIEAGFSGRGISEAYKKAEKSWLESNFTKGRDVLLEELKNGDMDFMEETEGVRVE